MNLGGDHLKFAFNRAELSGPDRELLSRIAGILITAHDYTISVNGHTDDVGSAEYNLKLSERLTRTNNADLVRLAGLDQRDLRDLRRRRTTTSPDDSAKPEPAAA